MPTVPQGGKVLVSGANGYVAMWTAKLRVRGTVRSAEKGRSMSDYFTKPGYGEAFEFVVVEDIIEAQDGAFDEVIKDVDTIEHKASPAYFDAPTPRKSWDLPFKEQLVCSRALWNTLNRIMITSSTAAIMTPNLSEPRVFSERDWNEASPKEVEELGSKAAGTTVYRASKSLAERAVWEFYNQHKSQVSWDLTVINPSFVFGPPIHDVGSPKSLNSSLQTWYDLVVSESPKTKEMLSQSASWVDVRDTAFVHVLALKKEAAGGERILLTSGVHVWQEWSKFHIASLPQKLTNDYLLFLVNVVNNLMPNLLPSHKLTPGYPEILQQNTIPASLEDFARHGWCD
ncbi:unnamed protein product [Cyclocybe aegerita]|uniref:NAD-dependent epimerase/dehydratase domain-containing protein n=1 Tax=Cyclocybe aegerita TaxID=1973307 RepID=A0A8S0WBB5_CYCAE|nr:unnamed protein product [Cyclocybe aegerita]